MGFRILVVGVKSYAVDAFELGPQGCAVFKFIYSRAYRAGLFVPTFCVPKVASSASKATVN